MNIITLIANTRLCFRKAYNLHPQDLHVNSKLLDRLYKHNDTCSTMISSHFMGMKIVPDDKNFISYTTQFEDELGNTLHITMPLKCN